MKYAIAIFIYDVEIILVLAYTNQSHQLRMMSYLNGSYYFTLELFFRTGGSAIFLYLLYSHFSASPLTFEHFRGVTVTYLFFKNQTAKLNQILICVAFNLLYNKFP